MTGGTHQKNRGLEGCYVEVRHPAIRLILKEGRYEWGSRDIHDFGTFTATHHDSSSCVVELNSELVRSSRRRCRITRRGLTYSVKELPEGGVTRFKRDDGILFLAESPTDKEIEQATSASKVSAKTKSQRLKRIDGSDAAVSYYLTGESVIRARVIPAVVSSKSSAVIRLTHSNVQGRVGADISARCGNPKRPLGPKDFNTVSDWRRMQLVEDLLWNEESGQWIPKGRSKDTSSPWSGSYELEIQFPKGHQRIEFKIVSRVKQVCSIVLSNWKIHVR